MGWGYNEVRTGTCEPKQDLGGMQANGLPELLLVPEILSVIINEVLFWLGLLLFGYCDLDRPGLQRTGVV